jgi:uncharacterized repeat protein (TIGR04076 family)
MEDHQFTLYNLRVETIEGDKPFVCSHEVGKAFELRGENLYFERAFSIYALSALLPLLPAKQRLLNEYDWMATDHIIACPDPHCGAKFKITRTGSRTFSRAETTIEPLPDNNLWKG